MNMQTEHGVVDVAVLIIFSTRTVMLRRTFEAIRKARPARLFLYQDRPRNDDDEKMVEAARCVVDDGAIDWPCDVRRNYHSEHSSAYSAIRWAFSLHDKCIVLEEGSIPVPTFIPFCKELLDRYENDLRIGMIAGFNPEEHTESPYDYLFTTMMPVWGWASWRRVVDGWDGTYSVVDDAFNMLQLDALSRREEGGMEMPKMMRKHKQRGQPVYETVLWSYLTLNSCLTIVPTRNKLQISDVAAHNKALPGRKQKLLTMKGYDVTFPLCHPRMVIENIEYKKRVLRFTKVIC